MLSQNLHKYTHTHSHIYIHCLTLRHWAPYIPKDMLSLRVKLDQVWDFIYNEGRTCSTEDAGSLLALLSASPL